MARWTDLAPRQEHTQNQTERGMLEYRGVVVHIAQGTYEGTIAWQKNTSADVSSHFIVSKTGAICQMVDTADAAWTQVNGNGHWISVENEGYSGTPLTDAQVKANAEIFARVCSTYGVPLQVTSSTSGRGLGHHAMGGAAWGNHPDCPGSPIINQKQLIVDLAKGEDMATPKEIWDYLIQSEALGDDKASQYIKSARGTEKKVDETVIPTLTELTTRADVQDATLHQIAADVEQILSLLTGNPARVAVTIIPGAPVADGQNDVTAGRLEV